jgi:hypothetical protein
MKFVYFVENLATTGSYNYGTTVSTAPSGFSQTTAKSDLANDKCVFSAKIKSIICEFLCQCCRIARSNTSGNFIFYFMFSLIFLNYLMNAFFCSLINVTR